MALRGMWGFCVGPGPRFSPGAVWRPGKSAGNGPGCGRPAGFRGATACSATVSRAEGLLLQDRYSGV